MGAKVSIVVPIYRVEKYLEQCIQSLLAQTLKEIEIILVDDGSPDQSGIIADRYAAQFDCIKVVHQENMGLGPARNTGIAEAEGEYIGFVDSDDWVRAGMYESLYNTAVREKADVVVSGHCDVSNGTITVKKVHPLAGTTLRARTEIDLIRKKLYGHGDDDESVEVFPMSVCMSIYSAKLIKEQNLSFYNILSEDSLFNLSAYRHANVISFTDGVDYCYRKDGQQSITQSFSEKKRVQFCEFLMALAKMAATEQDATCAIRAQRTAIDYIRMYVGIVDNANISVPMKIKEIENFVQDERIKRCCGDYPLKYLPIQQRIFQMMIMAHRYEVALLLNRIRQAIKKGMRQS